METNYFTSDTYETLFNLLSDIDQEEGSTYAAQFAAFFRPYNGYYIVNSLTEYTAWVEALLGEPDPDSDFFAWGGSIQIKSNEGGGVLPG